MKCSVCTEETNLDESIIVGERYFCKYCQNIPIGAKARRCQLESCGKMIINPSPSRKYHKECAEKINNLNTRKSIKSAYKDKREAWKSISDEKKIKLMNEQALRFLHEEEKLTIPRKIETFINIKVVDKV